MSRRILFVLVALLSALPAAGRAQDARRWERRAQNVTIIRDDWGIAHVYGRSDADAVFGMIYAQAEDDFNRVETNYLTALGRTAEAEGEALIWQDLRQRFYYDPDSLRALYRASPAWLRRLCDAWADGLNFYLARHPEVHPRALARFEPWMALSFTEGSIGGDIERIGTNALRLFYDSAAAPAPAQDADAEAMLRDPGGSNGIAIAPALTRAGHAMLLINPHTSFFFRSELQMVSGEGLNAYGAATWGQFFIYQGFNDRVGWMHTSSGVDNIDEWIETVTRRDGRWYYRYGGAERPVMTDTVQIRYRTPAGLATRTFTVYRTHHGPIVRREAADRWISTAMMFDPVRALTQSYTRTKARTMAEYLRIMELHTNSSNNTLFATADGDIAYFHSNFIPRRDTAFDWTRPVDGADPATDWHGVLSFAETPNAVNPGAGWAYNANDAPWWAAGPDSPREADYPRYVQDGGTTARGRHAVRVLTGSHDLTLDSLQAKAFDSYLPWFEVALPGLLRAWDGLPAGDSLKARTADQVALLREWDLRWSAASVPTSLGVFWGVEMMRRGGGAARRSGLSIEDYLATRAGAAELLGGLAAASDTLAARFGTWHTPWGDINRFQRLTDDIVHRFDDAGPSIPVPFTAATWGSLASFAVRYQAPGLRKLYGTSGNSFVAVVEFGDSVRARAVTAGGESGDVRSPHFNDQAGRYATGHLRDVYYYRSQLRGHTEREYHPGR